MAVNKLQNIVHSCLNDDGVVAALVDFQTERNNQAVLPHSTQPLRYAEIGTSWIRNNPIQVVRYARIKPRRIPATLQAIADHADQVQPPISGSDLWRTVVAPHQATARVHLAGVVAHCRVRAQDVVRDSGLCWFTCSVRQCGHGCLLEACRLITGRAAELGSAPAGDFYDLIFERVATAKQTPPRPSPFKVSFVCLWPWFSVSRCCVQVKAMDVLYCCTCLLDRCLMERSGKLTWSRPLGM